MKIYRVDKLKINFEFLYLRFVQQNPIKISQILQRLVFFLKSCHYICKKRKMNYLRFYHLLIFCWTSAIYIYKMENHKKIAITLSNILKNCKVCAKEINRHIYLSFIFIGWQRFYGVYFIFWNRKNILSFILKVV